MRALLINTLIQKPVITVLANRLAVIIRLLSLHFAGLRWTELLNELINWYVATANSNQYRVVLLHFHNHFFETEHVDPLGLLLE